MMKLSAADDTVVFLHCECGCSNSFVVNDFQEITEDYVIPNKDIEIVCRKCGVKHTNSVIVKETEPVIGQPVCNVPRCPTCQSPRV